MKDEEVLKELKVFRRMMKSKNPYGFLRGCTRFGIVKDDGWVSAVLYDSGCSGELLKAFAREVFLADLLED